MGVKTAVVFIHGQGEQHPMEGVRELARTMWDGTPQKLRWSWVALDDKLGLSDLGRVKGDSDDKEQIDFYEHYWAHLMHGNRAEQAVAWIGHLLRRPRRDAPDNLLPIRQWVIRFLEFAALTTIIFTYVAALLIPSGALVTGNGDPFWGATRQALDIVSVHLGQFVVVATGAAIAMVAVNEIRGGARGSAPAPNFERLKRQSGVGFHAAWVGVSLFVFILLFLIVVFARQGPVLDAGDLRIPMLSIALVAAGLLVGRQVQSAAIAGVAGAGLGTLAVAAGGASEAAVAGQPWPGLIGGAWSALVFAGLWFLFGLIRSVSCSVHLERRLVYTLITFAAAYALGQYLYLQISSARHPWADLLYVTGTVIVVVGLLFGSISALVSRSFLAPVMADAARYLGREPENVRARARIRELGLKLLEGLHKRSSGYDRIIIVAHSLGTFVGYELLSDYWASYCGLGAANTPAFANVASAANALEAAKTDLAAARRKKGGAPDQLAKAEAAFIAARDAFRLAQEAYQGSLNPEESEHPWLVTDFITLGSPLNFGHTLLARDPHDFILRKETLELATCPPAHGGEIRGVRADAMARVGASPAQLQALPPVPGPHYASLFAAVRWTNLHFKREEMIVAGDLFGGPIAPVLGPGVVDIELDRASTGAVFAHNEYWVSRLNTLTLKEANPAHISALRNALNL